MNDHNNIAAVAIVCRRFFQRSNVIGPNPVSEPWLDDWILYAFGVVCNPDVAWIDKDVFLGSSLYLPPRRSLVLQPSRAELDG